MRQEFPFEEETRAGVKIRTFKHDVPDEELVWHRDDEDREVHVISGDGWYFQRDDELPTEMKMGDVIHIPQRQWHRVIKRLNTDLVLSIKVSHPTNR